ncbi:uncharacterized protein tmem108 isoform 2-T2 [Syngnathus typhle]
MGRISRYCPPSHSVGGTGVSKPRRTTRTEAERELRHWRGAELRHRGRNWVQPRLLSQVAPPCASQSPQREFGHRAQLLLLPRPAGAGATLLFPAGPDHVRLDALKCDSPPAGAPRCRARIRRRHHAVIENHEHCGGRPGSHDTMKTSLQVLRCQLLSVLALLTLPVGPASSAHELQFGDPTPGRDAMATAAISTPRPDWHQEGSSSGTEWSAKADVVLHATRASNLSGSLRELPAHHAITLREAPADMSEPPTEQLAPVTLAEASVENQTSAVAASQEPSLRPTNAAANDSSEAITPASPRPNTTDSDPLAAPSPSASATPDRHPSTRETVWTEGGGGSFLNRQVPATTRDPWGIDNSSGPGLDSSPSSRVAICLSRVDIVWIVLAISVPVSTCSVLLTVCCMRRRKKSSSQENNLSYWNNAITMDYFSRHAVELPREIHTLESEEHDSCLPPNGDYGVGSVVLVNPFCQETLFINRDKASAI